MTEKSLSLIQRFVKAFLAGGVSSVAIALAQTPSLSTLADLKVWLLTLGVAFVTGGLMAIEKWLRWEP